MRDDERIDGVLRAAMSVSPPEMSPAFAQDVQRRTAPMRLSPGARLVMWGYTGVSLGGCVWLLRDVPFVVTAIAITIQAVVAVGLRSYTRHLVSAARP